MDRTAGPAPLSTRDRLGAPGRTLARSATAAMIRFPRTTRYTPVASETRPGLAHPDCPAGVTLVVYQTSVETAFSNRTTARTTVSARCTGSGADLPVVGWTDEMARDAERLRADARLAPTSYRVKREIKIAFGVGAVVMAIVTAVGWMRLDGFIADIGTADARVLALAADPRPGDVFQAYDAEASTTTGDHPVTRYRWWVVRRVTGDAVDVQAEAEPSPFIAAEPDLDAGAFSGPAVTIPRTGFLSDGRFDLDGESVAVVNAGQSRGKAR